MATTGLTVRQYATRLAEAPAELHERLHDLALDLVDRFESRGRDLVSTRLRVLSRTLMTSIRADLVESEGAFAVEFAAGGDYKNLRVRYARLQEEGGTVVPKRAGALTIPQEAALTGPGIPKYPSAALAPRLVLVKKTKTGIIVISRTGEKIDAKDFESKIKGEIKGAMLVHALTGEIWYALVRKVTVPAHWYMRDAFNQVAAEVPDDLSAIGLAVA